MSFDSIGIPSHEGMLAEYGSPENFQKVTTEKWMKKITEEYLSQSNVIFEGQMRIAFIVEALKENYLLDNAEIILVDCNDEERFDRLKNNRNQPELCTDDMLNWAKYLRNEAVNNGIDIVDTSKVSLERAVQKIMKKI